MSETNPEVPTQPIETPPQTQVTEPIDQECHKCPLEATITSIPMHQDILVTTPELCREVLDMVSRRKRTKCNPNNTYIINAGTMLIIDQSAYKARYKTYGYRNLYCTSIKFDAELCLPSQDPRTYSPVKHIFAETVDYCRKGPKNDEKWGISTEHEDGHFVIYFHTDWEHPSTVPAVVINYQKVYRARSVYNIHRIVHMLEYRMGLYEPSLKHEKSLQGLIQVIEGENDGKIKIRRIDATTVFFYIKGKDGQYDRQVTPQYAYYTYKKQVKAILGEK